MTWGLLTAGSGQAWENELVTALDRPGAALTVLRRCVDIGEVLAEAATGQAMAAVVAADLRRLDTDAVQRLSAAGVALVAVHRAGDQRAVVRLERIGITEVVPDDAEAAELIAAISQARTRPAPVPFAPPDEPGRAFSGVADPWFALPSPAVPGEPEPLIATDPPPRGRVVAVWGPTGSPGRTTVAAGLAVASSATAPCLLVDADVYGGVLASAFGLLDESPGLAGVCRQAAAGRLDLAELTRLVWSIGPGLRLLTGIARADRWPEVRPSALPQVLRVARSMAPLTVIDCGFAVENDEELSFDTAAPRRNGATLAVLEDADLVLVVGSADPPGMERLIRALSELADVLPAVSPRVVLNRIRSSASGAGEAAAALRRYLRAEPIAALPEDRAATDRAWRAGISLAQAAPASGLTKAFAQLARDVGALVPVQ